MSSCIDVGAVDEGGEEDSSYDPEFPTDREEGEIVETGGEDSYEDLSHRGEYHRKISVRVSHGDERSRRSGGQHQMRRGYY